MHFTILRQIPPEITRALREGRSGAELKKSDMWSIGVCSYVLVTGYIPFSGNTMKEVLRNIHCREREGLRFPDNCNLKRECRDFLDRLLCIDVKARATAEEALKHPFITGSGRMVKLTDPDDSADLRSSDDHLSINNSELKENIFESESSPSGDSATSNRSSGSSVDTELTSSSEN